MATKKRNKYLITKDTHLKKSIFCNDKSKVFSEYSAQLVHSKLFNLNGVLAQALIEHTNFMCSRCNIGLISKKFPIHASIILFNAINFKKVNYLYIKNAILFQFTEWQGLGVITDCPNSLNKSLVSVLSVINIFPRKPRKTSMNVSKKKKFTLSGLHDTNNFNILLSNFCLTESKVVITNEYFLIQSKPTSSSNQTRLEGSLNFLTERDSSVKLVSRYK